MPPLSLLTSPVIKLAKKSFNVKDDFNREASSKKGLADMFEKKRQSVIAKRKSTPTSTIPKVSVPASAPGTANTAPAGATFRPGISTPSPLVAGSFTDSPIGDVIAERSNQRSDKDFVLDRLTEAFGGISDFDKAGRRDELERSLDVDTQRELVEGLRGEQQTTLELLDNLEGDIKERVSGFVVPDANFRRKLAAERGDLTDELGRIERVLGTAQTGLSEDLTRIDETLTEEEQAQTRKLDLLTQELGIREQIDTLFADEEAQEKTLLIADAIDQVGSDDPIAIFRAIEGQGVGLNDVIGILNGLNDLSGVGEAFTLSPGERRFDAEGKLIASGAAREFESGGGGQVLGASFGDPFQERNVLREIVRDLPVGQQDGAFATIGTFSEAGRLLDLLNSGVDTGPVAGRKATVQSRTGKESAELEQFNDFKAAATGFTASYIKALSGVQVSDKERKFLEGLLPLPTKQPLENRRGIIQAMNRLRDKYQTQLGISFEDFPSLFPDLEALAGSVSNSSAEVQEEASDEDVNSFI